VAFTAVLQCTFQSVIPGFRRELFARNQFLHNGFKFLKILVPLFESLDISFELSITPD
jgi:hypothetical protein